jgi:hypothetical protein
LAASKSNRKYWSAERSESYFGNRDKVLPFNLLRSEQKPLAQTDHDDFGSEKMKNPTAVSGGKPVS